jgi:transcriptional regulator with GAF, ATPase, and Fis domain
MSAGTPVHRTPDRLFGRGDDLEYLTGFVDEVAVSDGALLLSGEAGVGKTVLLRAAAAHAAISGNPGAAGCGCGVRA